MYPELTPPLIAGLGAALAVAGYLAVFRPVLRRLAVRQVVRRPTEALLVVLGSLIGTALIMASLVVGDSLDRSVREVAYDSLGPIDEYVTAPSAQISEQAARRLKFLHEDPNVDGVLIMRGDYAAAVLDKAGQQRAEPRALIWEVVFESAANFGAPDRSGLAVADPGPGKVVVTERLARRLDASPGDRITFYAYGQPLPLTIAAVIPSEGVAGVGFGAVDNRNAFVRAGTLLPVARASGGEPTTTTFVSNRGGVESGARLTDEVTARIRAELGPLGESGVAVETPKQEVLDSAEQTSATLGSLFLFIASFSIIAGILLIVNIFVMLSEERKGQLGILRAVGMRRRRVTGEFAVEGALYSAGAALLGVVLGIGIGRVVVVLAMNILNGYEQGDNKLGIVFAVTPTSVVNGLAAGFLIAFLAVILTSVRIARTNIIAAIRDLERTPRRRTRKLSLVLSGIATAVLALASIPAIANSSGAATYLLPALTAVAAIPLLHRIASPRTVYSAVAGAVLAWGLLANVVRPRMFDSQSTATYVVLGCMLSFAAVMLVTEHQAILLRPLRPLVQRSSQAGLATRLAVAYPTAKRFRTGATLGMYSIVVLVIVLLSQSSVVVDSSVEGSVKNATGGWSLRADYSPSAPIPDPQRALTSGEFADVITEAAPLLTAEADASDPLGRTKDLLAVFAVGIPDGFAAGAPELTERLPNLPNDAAVWQLANADSSYVVLDDTYGTTGGPQGATVAPGDRLELTDRASGTRRTYTVAGVLADGSALYGMGSGEFRYPVLMGKPALRTFFGNQAQVSSLLLRTAPGTDLAELSSRLQAEFLLNGLVATDIQQAVRDGFASSRQFFQLMQGYLALGLLVGITGLGVIMVRAVRERRRTIAVLRALGFRASTLRWSFLAESTFIAVEGVVIGALLGVVTTWMLYENSPMFGSLDVSFPIAWGQIALTVGVTLVASMIATLAPARRAAKIRPAVALRIAN
jgi:putative ABC transport system permease protein